MSPHTHPPLLIVLCAGPTSLHHHGKHPWLSPSTTSSKRRYDVAVLHYGEPTTTTTLTTTHPYAPHTVHFEHTQGPKWSLLRTFLRQHRAIWQSYTYVAFPDDDLEMSPSDWNQLVDIADTHQLDVFQPAVVPPASDPGAPLSKYIRHTHVMPAVRDGFVDILRFVDMVEIMVPVFRRGALEVCVDGMGGSGRIATRTTSTTSTTFTTFTTCKRRHRAIDTLSRKLVQGLRHGRFGFDQHVAEDGYVELKTILAMDTFKKNTLEQVRIAVDTIDKQRLQIDATGTKIRARQGHSKSVGDLIRSDLLMQPLTEADVGRIPVCVHGTNQEALPSIKKEGLCRMARTHIHFATGLPGSSGVISGMRGTAQVLIYVDLKKALADGIPFFQSSNGVLLTPGIGKKGLLPPKYFLRIDQRTAGQPNSVPTTTRRRSRQSGGRGKPHRPRHRTHRHQHHPPRPHHPPHPRPHPHPHPRHHTHKHPPRPLPTTGILMDPNLRSGWGIDYALPQTVLPCYRFDLPPSHPFNAARQTYRYAIVDQIVVEHTRPLGNVDGKTLRSSFYRTYNINPEREMRSVLRQWRARTRPPRTLRHVPVPVDYSYVERDVDAKVPAPYNKMPARRVPYDTIRLPTFLESNLNRERLAVQHAQHTQHTQHARHAQHTQQQNKPPIDWSAYYYKLGYGFHARIRNNQLTVLHDLGSFQSRNWNTVQMLHEVLRRYTFKGIDVEILVCTDDKLRTSDPNDNVDTAGVPILVMAKTPGQTYVTYPDHTFYCWKEAHTRSWERERADIVRASSLRERETRRPVAFFRGNLNTSSVRKVLGKARRAELDVKGVDVGSLGTATTTGTTGTFTTLADHTAYKYLLHIPGRSYAARLKYLMATSSDVIYVQPSPAQEYREFWYDGLEPGVNCWVVRGGKAGAGDVGDVVNGVVGVVKVAEEVEEVEKAEEAEKVEEAEEAERGREQTPKENVRGSSVRGLRGAGEVVGELEWGGYWGRVIGWL